MKVFIFLISILFVFACNYPNQSTDKNSNDSLSTVDSTERFSEDLYLFTNNNVGSLNVGCLSKEVNEKYKDCDIIDVDGLAYGLGGGYPTRLVSKEKTDLFLYFTTMNKDTVTGFFILSPQYHTKSGIHVGMTTGELKKIYPDCKIGVNLHSQTYEGIYIKQEALILSFPYDSLNPIGLYKTNNLIEETSKMRLDGRVETIMLKPSR